MANELRPCRQRHDRNPREAEREDPGCETPVPRCSLCIHEATECAIQLHRIPLSYMKICKKGVPEILKSNRPACLPGIACPTTHESGFSMSFSGLPLTGQPPRFMAQCLTDRERNGKRNRLACDFRLHAESGYPGRCNAPDIREPGYLKSAAFSEVTRIAPVSISSGRVSPAASFRTFSTPICPML